MSFRSLLNVHLILCSFLKSRQALLPRVIRLLNYTVTSLGLLVLPSSSMLLSSSFSFTPAGLLIFHRTLMVLPVQAFSLFFSPSLSPCSFIFCRLLHTVRSSLSLRNVVYLLHFPWRVGCSKAEDWVASSSATKKNRYYFCCKTDLTPHRQGLVWFASYTWICA